MTRDLVRVEETIEAVSAVRHVLQAIRALARAQLAPVDRLAAQSTHWLDEVQQVLDRLTAPVDRSRESPRGVPSDDVVVVIGPERAFCGGLPRRVREAVPAGPVALVGQRLIDLADDELRARARFLLPAAASPDEVPAAARRIAEAVLATAPAGVRLLHPRGEGALHDVVLLPGPRRVRHWLPDTLSRPEVVIEAAVRELATGRLAVALADTLRAEVRARLAAADAAVHAADARLKELAQAARVQRQEQVTREILEIVASRLA